MKSINKYAKILLIIITAVPWLIYLPGKIYLIINNKKFYNTPTMGQDYFTYYYPAWKSFLDKGDLYIKGYYYPPFTVIFSILALLKPVTSYVLFSILNVFFALLIYRDLKSVIGKLNAIVTLLSYSSYACFFFGQINYIVYYLFSKAILLFSKKKHTIGILLLAIASSIKIFPAFLVPFIFGKKIRYYLLFIALLSILNGIPIILNPQLLTKFIYNLKSFGTGGISILDTISYFFPRYNFSIIFITLFYIIGFYIVKRSKITNLWNKSHTLLYLLFTLTHFWVHYIFMIYPILLKKINKITLSFLVFYTLRTPLVYVISKVIDGNIYYICLSLINVASSISVLKESS